MAFHQLATLFAALCLAFAAAQAALPGEVYWNSVLPNTTMPRAISNVLLQGNKDGKKVNPVVPVVPIKGGTRRHYTVENQEDGVVVPDLRRSGYKRKGYTLNTEENNEVVPDLRRSGYKRKGYTLSTQENNVVPDLRRSGYKRKGYTLNTEENNIVPDLRRSGYKRKGYTLNTEENSEVVPDLRRSGYKRKGYTLGTEENNEVTPDLRRSGYKRKGYGSHGLASNKNQVLVNPPSAPWFLEKDLYQGKQMEMEIARPESDGYHFIPRQVADSIPFSSAKFSTILDKLFIKPESPKAEVMKLTIKECELPAEEGEVKTCATSLESMIDFSIQHLGKHIQAVSTEAEKTTKLQKFTILKGIKQIGQSEAVACHKQNYPYAVFYCHDVRGARTYEVPFIGSSGTKVKAVGICHTNTTIWNPEHDAFKILKVKPGGEPICHFLPEYNVLWTTK